jgi:hypothetical protein
LQSTIYEPDAVERPSRRRFVALESDDDDHDNVFDPEFSLPALAPRVNVSNVANLPPLAPWSDRAERSLTVSTDIAPSINKFSFSNVSLQTVGPHNLTDSYEQASSPQIAHSSNRVERALSFSTDIASSINESSSSHIPLQTVNSPDLSMPCAQISFPQITPLSNRTESALSHVSLSTDIAPSINEFSFSNIPLETVSLLNLTEPCEQVCFCILIFFLNCLKINIYFK